MYSDNAPCTVCGSEVDLRPHSGDPRSDPDPDGPVDERVCRNPGCATNSDLPNAESPNP